MRYRQQNRKKAKTFQHLPESPMKKELEEIINALAAQVSVGIRPVGSDHERIASGCLFVKKNCRNSGDMMARLQGSEAWLRARYSDSSWQDRNEYFAGSSAGMR